AALGESPTLRGPGADTTAHMAAIPLHDEISHCDRGSGLRSPEDGGFGRLCRTGNTGLPADH
ncbi:MAG: hypothetical protein WBV36_11690, partial [Terriglobales bacterium]